MSPGSHLLASWLLANSFKLAHRERRIITLCGLAPDLDGVGWVLDRVNQWRGTSSDYFFLWHHQVGHNLLASLIIALVASALAHTHKRLVFGLAVLVVHLHLVCDLIGSKGPDGYHWPIPWLMPFNRNLVWVWSGQWELHAWQNSAITLLMLAVACVLGWKQRYSFVEVLSLKLDRAFFQMLTRYGW